MSCKTVIGNEDFNKKIIGFKEDQTIKKTPAGYDMVFNKYLAGFGTRFKEVRTGKLRCSQDKMGYIMNLSQSEVSRIERGQRKMNIVHLFTLKLLDPELDLNDLVNDCTAIDFLVGAKHPGEEE